MLPIYIIQVLGRFDYNYVNFEVFKRLYGAHLSSIALQRALRDDYGLEPIIILLAPTSLIMRKRLNEYREELLNLYIDDYNQFLCKFADDIKYIIVNDFDVDDASLKIYIIESMGRYTDDKVVLNYDIHPNNIKISMLNLLLKLWDADEIYIDISTGLNQYVNLLMDAFRGYIVNRKLSLQENYKLNTYYTLTHPVKKAGEVYRLYAQEFDVKAFLDWPLKKRKIDIGSMLLENGEKKRQLNIDYTELRNKLNRFMLRSRDCFNCIKYNIPLLLFDKPFIDGENFINYRWLNTTAINLRNKIIDLSNRLVIPNIERLDNEIRVTCTPLDYNYILSLHIAISLYIGLKESFQLPKTRPRFRLEDGEIVGPFKDIMNSYTKLGLALNARFLERDLKNIWGLKETIKDEWVTLSDLDKKCNEGFKGEVVGDKYVSDEIRNFYAHSGFLRQMIKIKKDGDWIEIKYINEKDVGNKLRRWLKDPDRHNI